MVRGLDQPIEVVIGDGRVILGAASRAMDLLVICHTTVWILHVQAKVSLCLRLLIFSGAASNVASQRALPDLLLYQLLILFVLLHILLEQLAKVRIQLVIAVLACLYLALLRR